MVLGETKSVLGTPLKGPQEHLSSPGQVSVVPFPGTRPVFLGTHPPFLGIAKGFPGAFLVPGNELAVPRNLPLK
jgi:hypothetical protein